MLQSRLSEQPVELTTSKELSPQAVAVMLQMQLPWCLCVDQASARPGGLPEGISLGISEGLASFGDIGSLGKIGGALSSTTRPVSTIGSRNAGLKAASDATMYVIMFEKMKRHTPDASYL